MWIFLRGHRVYPTLLAVALSSVLVISMFSVSEALKRSVEERYSESEEDVLITTRHLHNGIVGAHKISQELEREENISIATPVAISIATAHISGDSIPLIGVGVIPGGIERFMDNKRTLYLSGQRLVIEDSFSVKGDPHYEGNYTGEWTGEILLDSVLKERYGLERGSTVSISGPGGSRNFTVTGFFSTSLTGGGVVSYYVKGAFLMHLSELQDIMDLARDKKGNVVDRCWGILVKVNEGIASNPTLFKKYVEELKMRYPLYKVLTPEERFERVDEQYSMVRIFSFSISFISASSGILFLLGIMYINIQQLGQHLRILKAIGVSNLDIFLEVYFSSLAILTASFLLSILISYFVVGYINDYFVSSTGIEVLYAVLNSVVVLKSFAFFVGFGSALSILPAVKAMRTRLAGVRDPLKRW